MPGEQHSSVKIPDGPLNNCDKWPVVSPLQVATSRGTRDSPRRTYILELLAASSKNIVIDDAVNELLGLL